LGVNNDIEFGNVVSLMVNNSPKYIALWLGIAKIGATSSLINTNLKGKTLNHCLNISFEQSNVNNKK